MPSNAGGLAAFPAAQLKLGWQRDAGQPPAPRPRIHGRSTAAQRETAPPAVSGPDRPLQPVGSSLANH